MNKLVNLKEIILKARKNKYAVAHININNMEWIYAAIKAAQETNSPMILGVSEGAVKYQHGYKNVVQMVLNIMEDMNTSVPIVLHLDHGSYEGAIQALKAGFSSVMFDGSHYPFDENIEKTKKIIQIAKEYNATVEAEVGTIGGEEDGLIGTGELADANECKMISEIGVDVLAAGIGNIHGLYPKSWKGLNFDKLSEISTSTSGIPIVLHGGTGIPDDQIKKAINLGVSKINVNTECQIAFQQAIRKYIEEEKDLENKGYDPRKLLKPGVSAIYDTIIKKLTLFGSLGKA